MSDAEPPAPAAEPAERGAAPGGTPRAAGRALPPASPFAHDDGSADPGLATVLAEHAAGRAEVADVLGTLAGTRVLVPVLPHGRASAPRDAAAAVSYDPASREAAAAVVAVPTGDGRAAMPVFTSVAALAAWRTDVRPAPAPAPQAADAALAAGWQVLLLDPGGPVPVRLPRPAVVALARGVPWRPAVRDGAVDDEVAAAIRTALAGERGLAGVGVEPGERAEVVVVLSVPPGLDRPALDALVGRVNEALAGDETVAGRVDSLELRLRAAGADGPR